MNRIKMLKKSALLLLALASLFTTQIIQSRMSFAQTGTTLSAPLIPSSADVWEKFTYPLTPETFGVDDETFQATLAHVTQFRITTEFSGERDTGSLDSVSIGNRFRSNFDSGIEGWAARNDGTLEWRPSGGVEGGYIQISDWGTGLYHWAIAPPEWSGDWRDLIGSSIVFYLKTTRPDSSGPMRIEIVSDASKRLVLSAAPLIVPVSGTSTARVVANPSANENLKIALSSSDRNCMIVPDSVTIRSDQGSAEFSVRAAVDAELDCAAVIEASTSGYDPARITLRVGETPTGLPWETWAGQICFAQGIRDILSCLNAYVGGEVSSTAVSAVPGDDLPTPSFGSPEPAPVSRMTLQAGQREAMEGRLVYAPIWLINGTDVANINFTVGYDPAVVAPGGAPIRGDLLDDALFSANTGVPGLVRVALVQPSGITGAGVVAYIPFRTVGKPGDRTALDIAVSTINDPDGTVLAIDRMDGQILIVSADGVASNDCDGDGVLTEVDALCALQMSVQSTPEQSTLDLDADGQVTSRDSVIILQRAIGE